MRRVRTGTTLTKYHEKYAPTDGPDARKPSNDTPGGRAENPYLRVSKYRPGKSAR